jgi:hypothetical protein
MADIRRGRDQAGLMLCCHKQSFLGSRVYGDIVNVPASAADYPKRSAGEYVGWKRLLGDGNLHMKSHRWMTFV